jgi:hypothetical protein
MITSWKRVTRWISVSFSIVFLVILLTACGGSGGSSTATPTPKPPTVAPTTAPSTASATQLQTYTGTGFTIEYPQGWKAQAAQGGVSFTDAQQLNTFTIGAAPNPGGVASADKEADASLTLLEKASGISAVKPVSLPATTTVSGESWVQRGITGTVTTNGVAVPGELILLVNNHPAQSPTTQTYEIYYDGPSLSFQQEDATVFQPMLQTFKFTA